MGLTKYEGAEVACKEIKNNKQLWITIDGDFGIWLDGLTFKKDAKIGDKGFLHYWKISNTCGLWKVLNKGEGDSNEDK